MTGNDMNKIVLIPHEFNGFVIPQREIDGYINATAMCLAFGKEITDWLRTETTFNLVVALANKLGIQPEIDIDIFLSGKSRKGKWGRDDIKISKCFPTLVISKRGTKEQGGGTWIHYKLGVQLAQWLSPEFALIVSDWIETWLKTGKNPIKEDDLDRIQSRKQLRHEHRLYLTDTIKEHLEIIGQYYPSSKETQRVFAQIHDEINLIITGETAQEMRKRTGLEPHELLRDYFPLDKLTYYSALTVSAANAIKEGNDPTEAVYLAAKRVLPTYFKAEPIQLIEPIKDLEKKVFAQLVSQNKNQFALPSSEYK